MDALNLADAGRVDTFIESQFFVGVDLGQSHDPTAVAIVERHSGHRLGWRGNVEQRFRPLYQVRYLERLPLQMAYPDQIAYVGSLLRREPLASSTPDVLIDYTGVGRPVFDMFKQARTPRVKGVTITSGNNPERTPVGWSVPKTILVSHVQAKLHTGDLRIAKELSEAQTLTRELQDFRVRFTTAGNATFGAREGAHDDLVLAMAIAVFGGENQQRVSISTLRL